MATPPPTRETRALPSRRRFEESVQVLSRLHIHDVSLQLLALVLPMASPPSAVNFTADSSAVIGSRGSPFGTSTRAECDLPSAV